MRRELFVRTSGQINGRSISPTVATTPMNQMSDRSLSMLVRYMIG